MILDVLKSIDSKIGMTLTLGLAVLLILYTLTRRDRSSGSKFYLDDLLIGEDGRASKSGCIVLGAFLLTSWCIVYLTLQGKLDISFFGVYGGFWIGPFVANMFKPRPESVSVSTRIEEHTEVTK